MGAIEWAIGVSTTCQIGSKMQPWVLWASPSKYPTNSSSTLDSPRRSRSARSRLRSSSGRNLAERSNHCSKAPVLSPCRGPAPPSQSLSAWPRLIRPRAAAGSRNISSRGRFLTINLFPARRGSWSASRPMAHERWGDSSVGNFWRSHAPDRVRRVRSAADPGGASRSEWSRVTASGLEQLPSLVELNKGGFPHATPFCRDRLGSSSHMLALRPGRGGVRRALVRPPTRSGFRPSSRRPG